MWRFQIIGFLRTAEKTVLFKQSKATGLAMGGKACFLLRNNYREENEKGLRRRRY